MRTDRTFTTGSEEAVLAVSLELAAASWKVALHDGRREQPAVHTVAQPQAAARLQAVLDLIEAHKEKWSLPAGVRIVVSYEAGQNASWIYHTLRAGHLGASLPIQHSCRTRQTAAEDRPARCNQAGYQPVRGTAASVTACTRFTRRRRSRMRKLLATLRCRYEVDHKTFVSRFACDKRTMRAEPALDDCKYILDSRI